jgi:transposase
MEKEPTTLEEALAENRLLRAENAALRAENTELKARLAKVEEMLGLNSQNSSKPPSSDMKKPLKKLGSLGRPRGGQKGHEGAHRELWPEESLTEQIACPPVEHCLCGGRVALQAGMERRQVFELPEIQPEVREYQILTGTCCACGQTHRGQLPVGVPTGIVGPRLMAWMGMLASYFHLSKAKIQLLIQELLSIRLSTGTISAQEETITEALIPIYNEAHAAIQQSGFLHVDETGFRQGNTDGNNPKGTKAWIWTAVSAHNRISTPDWKRLCRVYRFRSLSGICLDSDSSTKLLLGSFIARVSANC